MHAISDPDFGELRVDDVWTGQCEVVFFGKVFKVELVVQTFDDYPVSEVQRIAFRDFESNKTLICQQVEQAILAFYLENLERYRECFDLDEANVKAPEIESTSSLRDLVLLRFIKVMTNFESDDREIGFVFDATFDPELGVGVLVSNGSVSTVDAQDFLLG